MTNVESSGGKVRAALCWLWAVALACGCNFDSMGIAPSDFPVASDSTIPGDRALVDSCLADSSSGDTSPCKAEVCNGKDDDCDGLADETGKYHLFTYCPVQSPDKPITGYPANYHCSRTPASTPPKSWTSAIAWLMAIFTGGATDSGTVEIDWIRLYVKDSKGKVTTLTEEKSKKSGVTWLGYWPCSAWFKTDDHTGNDSLLTLDDDVQPFSVHQVKDQIWHFGGERVPDSAAGSTPTSKVNPLPADLQKVWMKARVRVTGKAMIRGGFDFWKNFAAKFTHPNGNNTEGAAGPWQGASSGWVIISAGDAE